MDIADINVKRLRIANKLFKIKKSYTDYKTAIKNNKYEAVAICTPPHLHLKIAEFSVKYNNLFIEKPLGIILKVGTRYQKYQKKNLINYRLLSPFY